MKKYNDLLSFVESDAFFLQMFLVKMREEEEKQERIIALKNGIEPKKSSVQNLSRRLHRMYIKAMILKIQNNIENTKNEVEENETKE